MSTGLMKRFATQESLTVKTCKSLSMTQIPKLSNQMVIVKTRSMPVWRHLSQAKLHHGLNVIMNVKKLIVLHFNTGHQVTGQGYQDTVSIGTMQQTVIVITGMNITLTEMMVLVSGCKSLKLLATIIGIVQMILLKKMNGTKMPCISLQLKKV